MVMSKVNVELVKKYKSQILATLAVNIITFSHGNSTAWLATALPLLQSNSSPLASGSLTVEQASWLGSLLCCGGVIGNFGFGMLVNQVGRKISLYLIAVPHTGFWLMLMYGTEVYHLYIARILGGIAGGAVFVVIPTYISDIADNKIRGALGSMLLAFFNAGILSGFILGSYISYQLFPCIIIGISMIFAIAMYPFPETPQYLIKMKKNVEAENALKYYRNFKAASKEECQEFKEYLMNLTNTINGSAENKYTEVNYRDFLKPAAIRGLLAGIGLWFLYQFGGLFALVNYTVNIFQSSGSTMDPNACTIIIGAVQLLGTLVAARFVDSVGRRPLLVASCLGITIGSFSLAMFSYFSLRYDLTHFSWIAVTSVSIIIFLGSIGLGPLTIVVITEILPQKVKAPCITICMCSLTVMAFVVLKLYPVAMTVIGIHGVMCISGGVTAIGAVMVFFFLPETKGKCLEVDDNP